MRNLRLPFNGTNKSYTSKGFKFLMATKASGKYIVRPSKKGSPVPLVGEPDMDSIKMDNKQLTAVDFEGVPTNPSLQWKFWHSVLTPLSLIASSIVVTATGIKITTAPCNTPIVFKVLDSLDLEYRVRK